MASRAIEAGRAFLRLMVDDKEFNRGLNAASTRLNSFGRSVKQAGTGGALGGGPAAVIPLFTGVGAAVALAYPIKLAANLEVAAARLAVFTGSVAKARDILLDMQSFSAKALISTEELGQSVALLTRYNISADLAAASTKALAIIAQGDVGEFQKLSLAFAQVASAGKLTGEEVRQFKNTALNPLREISDRTGESMDQVRQRMEAGGVSFEEVAQATLAAVNAGGRFNGILEAIAGTLYGKVMQAFAEFKTAVLPIGDALVPILKEQLDAINDQIPAYAKLIKQNRWLVEGLGKLTMELLPAAFGLIGLGTAAQAAAFTIRGLSLAIGVLRTALTLLSKHPIIMVLAFAAAAIAAVIFHINKMRGVTEQTADELDGMKEAADAMKAAQDKLATATDTVTTAITAEAQALAMLSKAEQEAVKRGQARMAAVKLEKDATELRRQARVEEQMDEFARMMREVQRLSAPGQYLDVAGITEKPLKQASDAVAGFVKDTGIQLGIMMGFGRLSPFGMGGAMGFDVTRNRPRFVRGGTGRGGLESPEQVLDNLRQEGRGTFSGRLAGQIFGAAAEPQVTELKKLNGKQEKAVRLHEQTLEQLKRLPKQMSPMRAGIA